jgi:hypothetical protein
MNRLLIAVVAPLLAASVFTSAGAKMLAPQDLDPRLAGYPELTIVLTEERIEAPESVPAGRTLLVEENELDEPGHAFVLRIPDDVSDAEIATALGGKSAAEETPDWFWRADFVGNGDYALLERPAVSLVDLEPGRYLAGDPFRSPREYARFVVTAPKFDLEPLGPDPDADVSGKLHEMAIDLPAEIPAGRHVWEIENSGAMLHEVAIFPVPDEATPEQVVAAVSAELAVEFGGDPVTAREAIAALGSEWNGWTTDEVGGVGVLSPQRVSWTQFNLQPGTYAAVCFVPDPASGKAHLMMGMTTVFTVKES